ncbi:ATP-binding protein [Roseomonas sp. GCM10028921]
MAKARGPLLNAFYPTTLPGTTTVGFAVPVMRSDKLYSIMAFKLTPELISDLFGPADLSPGASVSFVDPKGSVILTVTQMRDQGHHIYSLAAEPNRSVVSGLSTGIARSAENADLLRSFSALKSAPGWSIVITDTIHARQRPLLEGVLPAVVVIAFMIILGVAISYSAKCLIIRPAQYVSEHARQLANAHPSPPDVHGANFLQSDSVEEFHEIRRGLIAADEALLVKSVALRKYELAVGSLEEQLRITDDRSASLFENSPDVMLVVNAEGLISKANAQTSDLFGYTQGELIGHPLKALLAPEVHDCDEWIRPTMVRAAREDRPSQDATVAGRRKDGTEVLLKVFLRPFSDEVEALLVIVRDVTEEHSAQSALADREAELRRLNVDLEQRVRDEIAARDAVQTQLAHAQRMEAVGQLTAGVAHDFNNVLQALLGGLDLALDTSLAEQERREFLEVALRAGRRGERLTSHLLSFSRKQALRPVVLDIAPLMHELARTLGRTLGRDIAISVKIQSYLPPAFVDPAHLDSALLNLALNARDAMPKGGTLHLEASEDQDSVLITVSDTGAGMPPEVLDRACEPFFSTKGVKGSGLGLSMVQGFAAQSGGELFLQSRVGEGTSISIRLPTADPAALFPSETCSNKIQGQGTVLVVEDDPDVSWIATAFLRRAGFEVATAGSPDQALHLLRSGLSPNILVTDFMMPGMNGAELIARARELRPELPALMITGYASPQADGHAPHDVPILVKPFEDHDLISAIHNLIMNQPTSADRLEPRCAPAEVS